MKLNHISALLFFLFVFAFAGYSQVEDEEVQMFSFSDTRSLDGKASLKFGKIKQSEIKTLEIEIKNTGKADLKVGQISIPEGVAVVVLNEVIKPNETGKIAVIVDPKYMKSGTFDKPLTISTSTVEKGTIVTKTATVLLNGQVL
jgi:hypothetical protein